jgi:N-acyl-D-amino-acid deacylase
MKEMDVLIKGGKLVDGTGSPWRYADLAVADGNIAAIGKGIPENQARQVIDARGKYVAPGFVDAHSHADILLLADQRMEYRIRQGITTEVVGQDGLSYAPVNSEHLQEWRRYLKGLNGEYADQVSWDWTSTGELLEHYEHKASNAVHLIPHGAVRVEVMGWADRPATSAELARMQDLVRKSLAEGGAGLSTGLTYIPCAHATTEEMIALCEPVGEAGGVFAVHLRSYAAKLFDALEEVIRIGRESGAAVQVSHLRMADHTTWGLSERVLELLEDARDEGVDITYDIYPYTVGCAPLFCLMPAWAQSGGPDLVIRKLQNQESRTHMRSEMDDWALDWSHYSLSNVAHPDYQQWEGQPLTKVARDLQKDVSQFVLEVLLDNDLDATIIAGGGNEADNRVMLTHPLGMIGSDGVMVGDHPHPRGFGTYPKLLTEYVRDNPILSLEEAIRKMTALPARRHNLNDRGVLSVGSAADVVVFSLEDLEDRATYQNALQLPGGVDAVLINGKAAVRDGTYLGSTYGKALRPLSTGGIS